ncbi:MAG: excinuclease ABC subunit UvrC [Rhodospirillales bacterium]|nr:excinuclease ABC subunit UvrC [Rhodospirillales bacterium]
MVNKKTNEKIEKSSQNKGVLGAHPESGNLPTGVDIIEAHLRTLDGSPGVYRMINAGGDVLYVGKAKNLKKRVASYTNLNRQSTRLRRMVGETATMEFVTTHTEAEALLLEANLIKRYKPRYNILLRDDKSFPKILLTSGHPFPQVLKHRGAESRQGEYFGPFASVGAVNETLTILQRAFFLRTCSDSVFGNRTRPCLLYQIKRCSAPCVERVDEAEYGELVSEARAFLTGESQKIQRELAKRMQKASDDLDYEQAAGYRDRIRALTRVQAHQGINLAGVGDADVIAAYQAGGQTCIEVFFFRGGRNFGNRAYYPSHAKDEDESQVLEAFIGQFYDNKEPPRLLLMSQRLPNQSLIADALGVKAGRKVSVTCPMRGDKLNLVEHALNNAREALGRRLSESASQRRLLEGLAEALDLEAAPERIEVYDNSHISGTKAIGGMIVAGPDGMMKNAYRKFTIKNPDTAPGDDYAMMQEVLSRRFSRALKEDPDRERGQWPDLVLIDGGAGQLSVTLKVLEELGIEDVVVAAIAKGVDRNAGRERIFLAGREPISLPPRDPVLYFLQRLRDEAHRFAIGFHRQKRGRAISKSSLDGVPGIGPNRKKALLHHFGSAPSVEGAGLTDLEAVEGISGAMAKKIYDWFHSEG